MSNPSVAALTMRARIHPQHGCLPLPEAIDASPPQPLGAAEFTLLELLCEGRSVEEIAACLDLDRDAAAGRIGDLIRALAR